MAIEIVSFPIKNGGSFHSHVNVYQRVIIDCEHHIISTIPVRHVGGPPSCHVGSTVDIAPCAAGATMASGRGATGATAFWAATAATGGTGSGSGSGGRWGEEGKG